MVTIGRNEGLSGNYGPDGRAMRSFSRADTCVAADQANISLAEYLLLNILAMLAVWQWFLLDIVVSWEIVVIVAVMMTKRLDLLAARQWGSDSGYEVGAEVMS